VLELQDGSVTEKRARQREWARLDEERAALAVRELEMMERIAAAERAVEQAEARARDAEQRWAVVSTAAPKRRPAWLPGSG